MLLKSNKLALVCLLAALCLSVEARRRSRIDLPAKNATTDTTTEESIATAASEKIEAAEKLDATTLATFLTEVTEEEEKKQPGESNSSEESPAYEDCDLDNISFEMITG